MRADDSGGAEGKEDESVALLSAVKEKLELLLAKYMDWFGDLPTDTDPSLDLRIRTVAQMMDVARMEKLLDPSGKTLKELTKAEGGKGKGKGRKYTPLPLDKEEVSFVREALAYVKGPAGKTAESRKFLNELLHSGAKSLFLRNRAQDFTDELRDSIPDADYWLATQQQQPQQQREGEKGADAVQKEAGGLLSTLFLPAQLEQAREAVHKDLMAEINGPKKLLWVAPRLAQTVIAPPMRDFIVPILKRIIDGSDELQQLGLDWQQVQILRYTLSEFDPDALLAASKAKHEQKKNHDDDAKSGKGAVGATVHSIAHSNGKRRQGPKFGKSARGSTDYCMTHGVGGRCQDQKFGKGALGATGRCKAHGGGK